MTHLTAWIVALTITGSPVTTAVCATVCGHEAAPAVHCHDSLTEPAPAAMSGEATCVAATSDVSYIKEDVAAPQVADLSATTARTAVGTFCECHATGDTAGAPSWLRPLFVLRL
jgi:hypothetical protein